MRPSGLSLRSVIARSSVVGSTGPDTSPRSRRAVGVGDVGGERGGRPTTAAGAYVWFKQFFDDFYNVDKLAPERISEQAWQVDATAGRLTELFDDVKVVPAAEGPHNIGWTHPEVVNPLLLAFIENGLDAVDEARAHVWCLSLRSAASSSSLVRINLERCPSRPNRV